MYNSFLKYGVITFVLLMCLLLNADFLCSGKAEAQPFSDTIRAIITPAETNVCKSAAQSMKQEDRSIATVTRFRGKHVANECRVEIHDVLNKHSELNVRHEHSNAQQICEMLLAAATNPRAVAVVVTEDMAGEFITDVTYTTFCLKELIDDGMIPSYRQ